MNSDSGYDTAEDDVGRSTLKNNFVPKYPSKQVILDTSSIVQDTQGVRGNLSPNLPCFSGNPAECIELHFSKFEKILQYYGTPQNEMVNVLGLSLDGDALLYFDLINTVGITFEILKSRLIERYTTEPIGLLVWANLHNRRRSHDESVRDFYHCVFQTGLETKVARCDFNVYIFVRFTTKYSKLRRLTKPTKPGRVF